MAQEITVQHVPDIWAMNMNIPSYSEAVAIARKINVSGIMERDGLADFGIKFIREALAATQEQPVPGIGLFALSRAIEMLRLGRNGRSICFCNDEIDALLAAGLAALRRAPSAVSSSERDAQS